MPNFNKKVLIILVFLQLQRQGKGRAKQRVARPAQAALFAAGVYLTALLCVTQLLYIGLIGKLTLSDDSD